jgi:hypothetical protein
MEPSSIGDTRLQGALLPAFIEAHNRRFEREPFRDRDAHRPLRERDDLTEILAWKEERTASMNLTLQYDQTLFILEPNG